ncbi:hypothetical protein DL770_011552 [Monosporascus sp. CRB-9-2]|nr:hypothetical protein DL770_011552 [Monosporascus sp. CRB-9-2]
MRLAAAIAFTLLSLHFDAAVTQPTPGMNISGIATTLFQLNATNTWFENLVVRTNGEIIVTRMDVPELWLIDPFTQKGRKLVEVPGVSGGTIGITEHAPDVFIFGAANFTVNPVVVDYGSMGIYRLELNGDLPVVSLAAALPGSRFLNGIARWNDNEVLVADTEASAIYRVDVTTGSSVTVLSGPDYATVNGLAVKSQYLYYTSTGNQTFFRVPLGIDATAAGPVEIIFTGLPLDDFALEADGTAYIATMDRNQVIRVSPNGSMVTVAGGVDSLDVAACTSVQFGRTDKDETTLYVTTSGGSLTPIFGNFTEPAKVVSVKLTVVERSS